MLWQIKKHAICCGSAPDDTSLGQTDALIREAYAARPAMRAQGRILSTEGRARIAENVMRCMGQARWYW
jgi:hypothetical protein